MKNTLTNIKSNLSKASVNKKLYVFLVCLFLSTFYWLINVLGNQLSTDLEVNVTYNNQPLEHVILNKLPSQLIISVTTDGYSLLGYQLKFKKPTIEINLSNYQFDELNKKPEIQFKDFNRTISNQLGNKIIINEILPKSTQVILDKKTTKHLLVIPNVKLTFKNQYLLSEGIIVNPYTVEVSGPASVLDSIKSIPTSFEEINNIEGSIVKKMNLSSDFLTAQHLQTKTKSVEVKIITDKFTEYKLNLPISITNAPDTVNIDFIPQTIEIKFLIPLRKLAQLNTEDFKIMVDYNELSSIYKKLKVHLVNHPDFVKNITLKPAKVEYVLKRKEK